MLPFDYKDDDFLFDKIAAKGAGFLFLVVLFVSNRISFSKGDPFLTVEKVMGFEKKSCTDLLL